MTGAIGSSIAIAIERESSHCLGRFFGTIFGKPWLVKVIAF